tara:strand:- start:3715 stop:3999 length:285 start_codon:yes stop_codon:yes gene_type:complete
MLRKKILEKALQLVTGDREKTHGNPHKLYAQTAKYWNVYLYGKDGKPLEPHDITQLVVLQKIARSQNGLMNIDDYVDTAGYASLSYELKATLDE